MRLLYFGLPLGALVLGRHGLRPAVVATWHRDAPGRRRLAARLGARGTLWLDRPDLDDPGVLQALRSTAPEGLLSWYWPRRLPPHVLAIPRRGAWGVHPSLLPRWRGPDPVFHAIRAGDAVTGVSLHRLDATYDTGDVVAQVAVPVPPDVNAWRLSRLLDLPSLALLVDAAARLVEGRPLVGRQQEAGAATSAPAPDAAALAIDWRAPAAAIVRLVRAAAPYPGAQAWLGDLAVEVVDAAVVGGPLPPGLAPGEAVRGDPLVVRAGDGAVALLRVRTEDGREHRGAAVAALVPDPGPSL